MKCITLFFSFCLIAIFSIAQPNYDFSKLKRERLGRGNCYPRESVYCGCFLALFVFRPDE